MPDFKTDPGRYTPDVFASWLENGTLQITPTKMYHYPLRASPPL